MAPPWVVKVGDIVDAGPARLCSSRQNESVERLGLQRAEETLDDGIVPTVAFSAHAALDSVASQESSILPTRVLHTTIRMMNHPARRSAVSHGHLKRRDSKVCPKMVRQRPANHAPRKQVHDDGQVQPAFPRADVGYVRRPDFVWRLGQKLPLHEVWRRRSRM